jgi:hypothetical protein
MRTIFLDIDGVLVTERYIREEYARTKKPQGRAFDPLCVEQFNRIIEEIEPEIVISSTWRLLHEVAELKDYFVDQGIKNANIVGYTPTNVGQLPSGLYTSTARGNEIQEYLNQHPRIKMEEFCIIDDDSDMLHLKPYLFKTRFLDGLTKQVADGVIDYLQYKILSE